MTAEEHEREGRDRLDQSEPAEGQRVARDLVDLEADDGGEGAEGEAIGQARAEERAKIVLPEERLEGRHPSSMGAGCRSWSVIGSETAFSRRARTRNGIARAWTPAATTYAAP